MAFPADGQDSPKPLLTPGPLVENLKALHTAAIDARHGYEEARHDAHGKGMSPLFADMIDRHTRNASDLAGEMGTDADGLNQDGSFMSVVHRSIMDVRALFGGLGDSVLPGLIDGEKRNVHQYQKVLASSDMTPGVRAVIETNRSRLEDALSEMSLLAAQSAIVRS